MTTLLERKLPRRIAGLVVGMMFACGAAFMITTALDIAVPRPYIFLTCLITLAALSLCFYNRITALVTILGAAAFAAWFFILGGGVEWITEGDGRLLIEKLVALIRTGAGDEASRKLAARLISYAVCMVSFCTACRLAGGVTLAFGTLAIFLAVWYTGTREVFGCLALCACATVAVSAAGFGRRRARLAGGSGDGALSCGSPAGAALYMIPVALLLAMAMTMFRPLELSPAFRIRAVERTLDDMVDLIASRYTGFTRRTSTFSLNAVGYGSASDLGGPVTPSNSLTLAVSTSDEGKISLIRGSVRTNYTGSGWVEGEMGGSYRFGSDLWRAERNDAFDLQRSVSLASNYFLSGFEHVNMRVSHYSHYTSMFTVDRPEQVISHTQTPYFNLQGELFPKSALSEGEGYTVSGWAFKGLTRAARRGMSRLVEVSPKGEQSDYITALYADCLPDGEVDVEQFRQSTDLSVLSSVVTVDGEKQPIQLQIDGDEDGIKMTVQQATVSVTARRMDATPYALFYGYTQSQLDEIERLDRLAANGAKPELLNYPQPTPMWLSGARLASYGLNDEMYGAAQPGGDWNENARQRSRDRYFVVLDPEPNITGYIDHWTYPLPRSSSAISGANYADGWQVSSSIYSLSDGWQSLGAGMATLAESNGFARLEYAGSVNYYPGLGEETAHRVASNYLSDLEEGDDANLFDLGCAIAEYLSQNFTYTLSPSPVPDGVDFVDWFMSTGEGYCTYYASAMAVLARDLGIPSRYVEGYALTDAPRGEDGTYLLTGEQAHAWAELYFDGVGFLPFDPLSVERLNQQPDDSELPEEPAEVETPTPPPTNQPSDDDADPSADDTDRSGAVKFVLIILGILIALAALLGGSAAVYLKLRSLEHLRRRFGDVGAARELWREILTLLPMLDSAAARREGETSLEYASRIKTLVIVPGAPFEGVAAAGMKAWYAESLLTDTDLVLLDNCATALRKRGIPRLKLAPHLFRKR